MCDVVHDTSSWYFFLHQWIELYKGEMSEERRQKKTEEKWKNGKRRSKQKSCTHRSDMFTNWFIMWQSALMSGFLVGQNKKVISSTSSTRLMQ